MKLDYQRIFTFTLRGSGDDHKRVTTQGYFFFQNPILFSTAENSKQNIYKLEASKPTNQGKAFQYGL